MINSEKKRDIKIYFQWLVLVVLVGILAVSLYLFVGKFESLRLHGYIKSEFRRQRSLRQKISPDQISGWMTFRYVNLVFGLPPSYLQSSLDINDARYPNISLDTLAKEQKLTSAAIVGKTVAAVKNFIGIPSHP
ncbi:MAG: hypothetical protein P4L74_03640 [Candidatus Doudnabacteria bacterium]|nr:hypothetical protein [Candidatus Doudnabacteria bacterium]